MQTRKFLVRVTATRTYDLEIEAETRSDAEDACEGMPAPSNGVTEHVSHEAQLQISGPWLAYVNWYDLHGTGNVIVGEPKLGHSFDELDIELLCARLELLGLTILETWNGAGCTTVTVRCAGRRSPAKLTDAEIELLMAPRRNSTRALGPIAAERASASAQAARRYGLAISSYYAARDAAGGQLEPDIDRRCDTALDGMWAQMTDADQRRAERAFLRAG